ncbi:MAG: hypothetical protein AAF937_12520, partial [Planctomycetota bacterium]
TSQEPAGGAWPRSALLGSLAVVVCACLAASIGQPGPVSGSASVLYLLLTQGLLASLYLLGAFGLGLGLIRLLGSAGESDSHPILESPYAAAAGLGLAAMLTITHALGASGGLSNRIVAVVPVAVGVALVARSLPALLASLRAALPPTPMWLAAAPGAGVLLAAACSPPGWLWSSEFGGYDTLVYHLQLPREWHAMGRVVPLEHNVYSYLPSYVESAFVHLAALAGTPRDAFVTDDGGLLIACKLLHAAMTLIAGWCAAGAARSLLFGVTREPAIASAIAGGIVIATPWSVVTGSMAYNEMAMLALLFTAVHFASASGLRAWRCGLLAGALVGVACGCKPTALLFGAPVVGIVLIRTVPARLLVPACVAGAAAGVVMLAPWLIRNAAASGNPVFPQLSSVFGSAHWSAEQIARYGRAHTFAGSFLDALRLLVLPDATDPAADAGRPVHRGILHAQWAFAGPIAVAACVIGTLAAQTRTLTALLLGVIVVQVCVWALTTHVQSRFLMPLLVPIAMLSATASSALLDWASRAAGPRRAVVLSLAAVVLATSAITAGIFAGEYRGSFGPNQLINSGSSFFTNYRMHAEDPSLAPPGPYLRAALPTEARVLIIGDATALYKPNGSRYATTYDESPLAAALRASPSDPRRIFDSLDATHIYVDWVELNRLWETGWADPLLEPERIQSLLASYALLEHEFIYDAPGGERVVAQELYRLPEPPR